MYRLRPDVHVAGMAVVFALVALQACSQFAWGQGEEPAPQGGDEPAAQGGKGKKPEREPDYTRGEQPTQPESPWALGATGAFGHIWHGDQRMIQIESIANGSPAEGQLKQLDVLIGVILPKVSPDPRTLVDEKCRWPGCGASGKTSHCGHFTWEARKMLSAAITEAEKADGKLLLNVWRPETESATVPAKSKKEKPSTKLVLKQPISGKIVQVTLTLPKKGTFSATSPWKCEKTEALIADAAQAILKGGLKGGIPDDLNALGLLATGDEKYLPAVRDYVHKKAKDSEALDVMGDQGIGCWHGGYQNILMTEYYLLTRDETVLPGIKALSEYLAYGQSGVGTWSHGIADVKQYGLYGPSAAYGAMNAATLPIAISLVLAQKCGITTTPVNDAVNRSKGFYRYYVDKGTIPYGEHPPAFNYDGNGKNSMAAVFFDLLGDQEATKYFARMTLASSYDREPGHTGHFFAWQWGALGASRGGPAAAQAFAQNTRWFTELERRADSSSVYQYQLRGDHHKYGGWETTGQRLMQHCLPRKVLYLTGKVDSCIAPFTDAELKETLDADAFDPKRLSVKELLAALGSWSLLVRKSAAQELGQREDDLVEPLIAMLDSPSRYARYGACTALQYCGRNSEKAVAALVNKIENDKDMTLRYFAVNALHLSKSSWKNGLGNVVTTATPALLKIAAAHDPEQDPLRMVSGQIAAMLFYAGNVNDYRGYFPDGKGTEELDRNLLIPAMKAWLANPNGGARSLASSVFKKLKEEDLQQLWPEIYIAAKYPSPAGAMFGNGVRANGVLILAQNRFEEGIPLGLDYLYQNGWGKFARVPAAFNALAEYGSAMKPYLEEMRTREYERYVKTREPKEVEACKRAWQKLMDNINKTVVLRSIKPFLEASGMKEPEKVFPPKKEGARKQKELSGHDPKV